MDRWLWVGEKTLEKALPQVAKKKNKKNQKEKKKKEEKKKKMMMIYANFFPHSVPILFTPANYARWWATAADFREVRSIKILWLMLRRTT